MAKRKVRDDADITAAPTKKTKTSAKKGRKAADEDGMYIVVRLLAQCLVSLTDMLCWRWAVWMEIGP
jgi:hypothetical protein